MDYPVEFQGIFLRSEDGLSMRGREERVVGLEGGPDAEDVD
jgi:hypothetical protein